MSALARALWGVLLVLFALGAAAEQRLALVIGNSAYKVGPLRNPLNDARAMAGALRAAGFEVMHGENLSHRQLFEMTRDFGRRLNPGVVALFYHAGHGLQVRDRNFLIPVEADPQTEEEVPDTSVDVNFLLDVMDRARSRVNIVILDACRNNPFARSFRSRASGLAQMEAPSGTLIACATAPGRVASGGAGEHGLLYAASAQASGHAGAAGRAALQARARGRRAGDEVGA
ncbi:MAG: caspase family protein, partial [Betaproteobacteria bacterium]